MASDCRNPVPGSTIPRALECVGQKCTTERESEGEKRAGESGYVRFECPNRKSDVKADHALCPGSTFLYPRKVRADADAATGYFFHYHQGIDLGGRNGETPILAVAAGIVTRLVGNYAERTGFTGYGRCVVIHGDNGFYYLYAHCSRISVRLNERVQEQQEIALVGRTGHTNGTAAGAAEDKDADTAGTAEWEAPKAGMISMAPHLHFEVSSKPYPKRGDEERTLDGDNPDVREDPGAHLRWLGPWGASPSGSTADLVYLPTGELAVQGALEAAFQANESQAQGGFFPLAGNTLWHGGVHLFGVTGQSLCVPYSGDIVALRLDEDPESASREYGSTNFILLRHRLPPSIAQRLGDGSGTKAEDDHDDTPLRVGDPSAGATNPAAQVREVKRMLHRIVNPAAGASSRSYYDELDHLYDPVATDGFIQAIFDFQEHLFAKVNPNRRHKLIADGIIEIPDSRTWRALRAAVPARTYKRSVGDASVARVSNEPEDVIEIKRRLNLVKHPDDSAQVFYDEPEELYTPTVTGRLIAAIWDFQMWQAERDHNAGRKVSRPDGVIEVPKGKAYRTLTALTSKLTAVKPTHRPSSGGGEGPAKLEGEVVLYSLLMHLEPVTLDEPTAKRFPWLSRVTLPRSAEEEEAERQRAENVRAERLEAEHRMRGSVGPTSLGSGTNREADVRWVQLRLIRFGYLSGEANGISDQSLVDAIKAFQEDHTPSSKGRPADGIVSRGKKTAAMLRKTPSELGLEPPVPLKPAIDPLFVDALRHRTDSGTTAVFCSLNLHVEAGEPLWSMGMGSAHNRSGHAPLVHWEVFAEHPLVRSWTKIEDPSSEFGTAHAPDLVSAIKHVSEQPDEPTALLTHEEIVAYYRDGYGSNLRELQFRSVNEWAASEAAIVATMQGLADPLAAETAKLVAPYLWWAQAGETVPASRVVWHHHPISIAGELARAHGLAPAVLRVQVARGGKRVPGICVCIFADEVATAQGVTDGTGVAYIGELEPGAYTAVATGVIQSATHQSDRFYFEAVFGELTELSIDLAGTAPDVPPDPPEPPVEIRDGTETIVVVGSERHLDSFWWKMMFFGAASRYICSETAKPSDVTTVFYVAEDYEEIELSAVFNVIAQRGARLMPLDSADALIDYINSYREVDGVHLLVQELVFFSHGVPGAIALDYSASRLPLLFPSDLDFGIEHARQLDCTAFGQGATIRSYACRTGISETDDDVASDAAARPEASLAQELANASGAVVYAFLRRTLYTEVLRPKASSERISQAIDTYSDTAGDAEIIELCDGYVALRHPGLAWLSPGAHFEDSTGWALWPERGGLALPSAGETPRNLSSAMRRFVKTVS